MTIPYPYPFPTHSHPDLARTYWYPSPSPDPLSAFHLSYRTLGTCSLCGGQVTIPEIWYGVVPPVPSCARCGAIAALPSLPVIPMVRPQPLDEKGLQEYVARKDPGTPR